MKFLKCIFVISILLNCFVVFSQTIPYRKSNNIVELSGKKYYLHKVLPKQTLYSISKTYKVSIVDILEINKKENNVLTVDEVLKIPVSQDDLKLVNQTKITNKPEDIKYYIVQTNETIFTIANKYNLSVSTLLKINNKNTTQVQAGERLQISLPKSQKTTNASTLSENTIPAKSEPFFLIQPNESKKKVKTTAPKNYYDKKYFYHYVLEKETEYTVAEKYNLKLKKLIRFNKWLKYRNAQTKDKLRIKKRYAKKAIYLLDLERHKQELEDKDKQYTEPTDTADIAEIDEIDSLIIPPLQFKKRYAIALLMPLHNSKTILKFYQGILLGLEEYSKKSSISIDLFTYNIENDSINISNILGELLLKDIDIIIGPFNHNAFNQIAYFGYSNNIPVVSLSAMYDGLPENVIQLNTSYITLSNLIASNVVEYHSNDKIILANADTAIVFSEGIYTSLDVEDKKNYLRDVMIRNIYNETFDYKIDYVPIFQGLLSTDTTNIVIVPCIKSSNVSRILSSLYAAKGLEKINIKVYGMSVWQFYEDIDPSLFYKLNIHYFSSFYTDYKNEHSKDFILKFRKKYMAEPHQISFRGFDTIWFILSGLEKFGNHFIYNVSKISPFLLNASFVFKKHEYGGYENIQVYQVVYKQDFTVKAFLLHIP